LPEPPHQCHSCTCLRRFCCNPKTIKSSIVAAFLGVATLLEAVVTFRFVALIITWGMPEMAAEPARSKAPYWPSCWCLVHEKDCSSLPRFEDDFVGNG